MGKQKDNLIISESLIIKLINDQSDQNIDNKHYKYLGKGQEGVVFLCDEKVIKIYTRINMDAIIKEFYVL